MIITLQNLLVFLTLVFTGQLVTLHLCSVSLAGRGSETLLRVQICGMPCSFIRVLSL